LFRIKYWLTASPTNEPTNHTMLDSPPAASPAPTFSQEVRNALAHLYDYAYLQNHPLALRLTADQKTDQLTRAQHLRRTLLDCIEALRPHGPEDAPARPDDARAYAVLAYRCVDGLTMPEIEEKLALSRRQAYREYSKAVEAVAGQLWDQLQRLPVQDDDRAPASVQQRLAVAQAEVERLRNEVRAEPLALADVVESVQKLLTPRLQRTGTQLTICPIDCPPVLVDRTMLRQALMNLLSHALDTIPGYGELNLVVSAEPGEVQLDIIESSRASTAERPPPFVKREGVGLAVAATLLEAQGGRLAVEPAPGRWRAMLTLPVAGEATILAVDDNQDLVALFQRYLGGHRITVLGAHNGQAAIAAAIQHHPRLIMLDVMMPQQDGWEILEMLQTNPATQAIPVIVCSVLNEAELALAMGASDYLTKPVNQATLITVLQRWLGPLAPAV
jgi:CheY-like chemotaxis protein